MEKLNSFCLPYFQKDRVSIFSLHGREIRIPISQFQDITSEGGRFHQFYTFLIGGVVCAQETVTAPKSERSLSLTSFAGPGN